MIYYSAFEYRHKSLRKSLCTFEKKLFEMGVFRIRDNTIFNGNNITEVDIKIHKRKAKAGENEFVVAKKRLKSFNDWVA